MGITVNRSEAIPTTSRLNRSTPRETQTEPAESRHREPVEPGMPALLSLGDPQTADHPGCRTTGARGSQTRQDVGVEKEALHQTRPEASEGERQPPHRLQRPAWAGSQRDDRNARPFEHFAQRPRAVKTDDRGPPTAPIEPESQLDEHPLGAADIQVGDYQGYGNGYRRVGPGPALLSGKRKSSRQVLHDSARIEKAREISTRTIENEICFLDCARAAVSGGRGLETSAFDFDLPDDLIAQHPVEPRDQSRLMVVERSSGRIEHTRFAELDSLLRSGDILVRNNTQVVPARLIGRREATGGSWEGLFLRAVPVADGGGAGAIDHWEVLARTRGKPAPGEVVVVGRGLRLTLVSRDDHGQWTVRPDAADPAVALLDQHGEVPLPPYIRKGRAEAADRLRYQTLYARSRARSPRRRRGSISPPRSSSGWPHGR